VRGEIALNIHAGPSTSVGDTQGPEWRGELEQRVDAYRTRRTTAAGPPGAQSKLPFGEPIHPSARHASPANYSNHENPVKNYDSRYERAIGVAEPAVHAPTADDDFSFTIAIGRYSPPNEKRDGRLEIDVSLPPGGDAAAAEQDGARANHYVLYPVASLLERRWAALIDTICLLFAYGGFLALFGSLGGQFTLSKLSFEVYAATFAIVYLQYFALFTVFGGTTPGMMYGGLQVASFSGEPPTPRRMLLRSLGYLISAATLFMGFVWAVWDEDTLTWHDRISRTYLTSPETRAHMNSASPAHSR
jgi:uncharacterized RDD family membrane protein YckC